MSTQVIFNNYNQYDQNLNQFPVFQSLQTPLKQSFDNQGNSSPNFRLLSASTDTSDTQDNQPLKVTDNSMNIPKESSSKLLNKRQNFNRILDTIPMVSNPTPAPAPVAEQKYFRASSPEINYKTELCKTFETTGQCRYGPQCRFAHGQEELASKKIEKKLYKVQDCENFFKEGICPYGQRCHFRHETLGPREIMSRNYYLNKLEHFELFENIQKSENSKMLSFMGPSSPLLNQNSNNLASNPAELSQNIISPPRRLQFLQNITKPEAVIKKKKLNLNNESFIAPAVKTESFTNEYESDQYINGYPFEYQGNMKNLLNQSDHNQLIQNNLARQTFYNF